METPLSGPSNLDPSQKQSKGVIIEHGIMSRKIWNEIKVIILLPNTKMYTHTSVYKISMMKYTWSAKYISNLEKLGV